MAVGPRLTGGGFGASVALASDSTGRDVADPSLDPLVQISTQRKPVGSTVTIGGSGNTQICNENLNRIALFVDARDGSYIRVVQDPSATPVVVPGQVGQSTPIVIHSSIYPVACQGIWYVVGAAGTVVWVAESQKV